LDVIAACQTKAAQEAAFEFLNFQDEYYIDLPERYILGVAFSTHPDEHFVKAFWVRSWLWEQSSMPVDADMHSPLTFLLQELYEKDVPNEKLRESIGEGLGALVNTFSKSNNPQSQKVRDIQTLVSTYSTFLLVGARYLSFHHRQTGSV
jgi:hypothetical protein